MTVSSTSSRVVGVGDGSNTVWPFPFKVLAAADLVVVYTDATGTDTTLSPIVYGTTGFGVDLGGTVTYPLSGSPIASGTKLTIYRNLAATQPSAISNQGTMWPSVIEAALDRLAMIAQGFLDTASRALKISPTDSGTLNPLPNATQRANAFLAVDAAGQPMAAQGIGLSAVSSWLATNFLPANSAAAARTALGAVGTGTLTGMTLDTASNTFKIAGSVLNLMPILQPQGRLTLTTATPVLTGTVSGAATIYYTPYHGNQIPIYDGANMVPTAFAELSNATAQSSIGKAGPAAVANNSNYDLFVWSDSGTIRLTRGPLWASDTTRGTGAGTTELQRINGIFTNKAAISNGPGANLATYVGTVRSNGTATIDWNTGTSTSGGGAASLNVWNAYNRVDVAGFVNDSTATWNYSSTTWRAANGSNSMRVSYIKGLQEDYFYGEYVAYYNNNTGIADGKAGIGYNSATTPSGRAVPAQSAGTQGGSPEGKFTVQDIGFNYLQGIEAAGQFGSGTWSWYGNVVNGTPVNTYTGLTFGGRF